MNNLDNFISKRVTYPLFVYNSYTVTEREDSIFVEYNFSIEGLSEFHPTWTFPKPENFTVEKIGKELLDNLFFNLGMVELVSYWKLTCSPKVVIKCGTLDNEQIAWWKKLYFNGLGEFLYTNGIYDYLKTEDIPFMEIECSINGKSKVYKSATHLTGSVIPVGGGKDSVVTLELLKSYKAENTCYIVNPRGASATTACIAGYDTQYTPHRTLDKNMLELNSQGFLNGHTPFSAILAFSSYIAAIILGKKYIVLSNEASANEPNVEGTNINHQYSKSIEFENDFREYYSKYLCKNGPEYFSLLRPWSEWQIVKEFVKHEKYFKDFKSCNVGSKQDIWCENCPKCLYVYIMLCGHLDKAKIKSIFKTDMLANEHLKDIFEGLIKPNKDKPFECVGTKEEINLSLNTYLRKLGNEKVPALLEGYELMEDEKYNKLYNEYNNMFNENNNVPKEYVNFLKEV